MFTFLKAVRLPGSYHLFT